MVLYKLKRKVLRFLQSQGDSESGSLGQFFLVYRIPGSESKVRLISMQGKIAIFPEAVAQPEHSTIIDGVCKAIGGQVPLKTTPRMGTKDCNLKKEESLGNSDAWLWLRTSYYLVR